MASNQGTVLCIPLGVSKVIDGQQYLINQWQNHYQLLAKIKSEYDALKESGSSYKPVATPVKTGYMKKPQPNRNMDKPQILDVGRVTRSMVKKTNATIIDSKSSSNEIPPKVRKGKKDNLTDSEKENRVGGELNGSSRDKQRSRNENSYDACSSEGTDKSNVKHHDLHKEQTKKQINRKNDHDPQDVTDWLTDDESFKSPMSTVKSKNKHSIQKPRKRKSSQYFTPSCPAKSCRFTRAAAARAEAQTINSSAKKKPFATLNIGSAKSSPARCFEPQKAPSTASSVTSSGTTTTPISKVSKHNRFPSDKKALTMSAQKRKEEAEKQKQNWMKLMEEKQKNALLQREAQIHEKYMKAKLKNQEEAKKSDRAKQIFRKQEEIKRLKEEERRKDFERRQREQEEARKAEVLRHQENLKKRQQMNDLKKQKAEEEERARLKKQEEMFKAKAEEIELKKKNEEEIRKAIQEHNKLSKPLKNPLLAKFVMPNHLNSVDLSKPFNDSIPNELFAPLNGTYNLDAKKDSETIVLDKTQNDPTFAVDDPIFKKPIVGMEKSSKKSSTSSTSSKNYDITEIMSDEDTDDDDEKPRNTTAHIPSWAQAKKFEEALHKQYNVSRKTHDDLIRKLFPRIKLPINLSEIFTEEKAVSARYEKRTSSAVWNSPLCMSLSLSRMSSPVYSPNAN